MYRDQQSGSWCFQVSFRGGRRIRRRAGGSRREAERALDRYVRELPESDGTERLSRVIDRFCARQELAESTVRNYRSTFRKLIQAVGDCEVGDVGERQLREFLCARRADGRLASTLHADLRRIRSLMRWAGNNSFPSPKRLGVPTPKGRLDFFTIEEIRKLLAWSKTQTLEVESLLTAYFFTGGRAREVLGLERSDVDLVERWVTFRLGLKGGDIRKVPICPSLHRVWARHLPSVRGRLYRDLRYSRVYSLWKTACASTGVRGLTLHHARHTCASMWVMSGVDLVTVKNWLGHASIQQTMVYAKVSPQHGHEAMSRFSEWAADRLC